MPMKMRDLEQATGVHRETIRVYFRYGLLPEPSRPKPNVADYGDSHVEAIIAIRDLQRRSGMTLREISDMIGGRRTERQLDTQGFQSLQKLVEARLEYNSVSHVTLASLAEQHPEAWRDAALMANAEMITVIEGEDGPGLSLTDARILLIWQEMRAAGFTEENGFAADIAAYYRHAAAYVATHDAVLFRKRTEGIVSADQATDMLERAVPLMLEMFGLMRLRVFLEQINTPEA